MKKLYGPVFFVNTNMGNEDMMPQESYLAQLFISHSE